MFDRVHLYFTVWMCLACTAAAQTDFDPVDTSASLPRLVPSEHLPNLVEIHPRVFSGGLPEDDEAFRELATIGVRTIISVDGAKPDVDAAKSYGLRYVHLPHGYDGIPETRIKELAKAVRDLDGPVYIHCHHGKHRSPAAASAACVAAGLVPTSDVSTILKLAGTSERYRGLFRSALQTVPIAPDAIDQLQPQFRPIAPIPPMAEAMVAIDHAFGHLKPLLEAETVSNKDHPDLDAAHEALLLREQFTESLRTPDVGNRPDDFRRLMRESESDAESLERLLLQQKTTQDKDATRTAIREKINRIEKNCQVCHAEYRDNPR
tara:strand:+ start:126978 stop:127937 length:960 start_codon:yes stop_codon:yes gene_type:complete